MEELAEKMDEFEVEEYDTDPKSFKAKLLWTVFCNTRLHLNYYEYKHSAICNLGSSDKRTYRMKLISSVLHDYWDLNFQLTSFKNDRIKSTVTFAVIGRDGIERNEKTVNLPDGDCCISIPLFYKKKYFRCSMDRHKETLKIICRINFICTPPSPPNPLVDAKYLKQISEDFEKLRDNKSLSDVILTASDTMFEAHKIVLSARSLVFAEMFNQDSKDHKKSVIQVSDVEPDILGAMLDFIYTGRVTGIDKKAHELMKVADRFELGGLKTMCEEEIRKTLTIENAIHALILADRYNCDKMRNYTLDFIKLHLIQTNVVPELNDIQNSNPEFAEDILRLYVTSKYYDEFFT